MENAFLCTRARLRLDNSYQRLVCALNIRKRSLYEGGTRVPSFAVWGGGTPKPTIPGGAVEHTPLSATDWLPTVLAIAGVALPPSLRLDGEDMARVFLDPRPGLRPPRPRTTRLFWEWKYGVSGPCENAAPHLAVRYS
jgi:hypothetical protein